MKTVFALSLVIALLSGCATAQPPATTRDAAETEVKRVLADILDAVEKKDVARLDSHHWYGPHFSKFSSSGARFNAEQARAGEHKGLNAVTGLKLRTDDLKVDAFGDSAIATFVMVATLQSGAETLTKRERGTLVFVRHDGSWKIVHEHFSPAP
jgi:ketosteroid isomerase-like protein